MTGTAKPPTVASSSPLVSIGIVCYNQKGFLRELVESIFEQDYENLEIVIADDASTDGTTELVLQLGAEHPGRVIPLITPTNLGRTRNANRLLAHCRGTYVCYVSGDDVYVPGRLRKMVAWMEANPDAALCACSVEVFNSDTNQTITVVRDKVLLAGGSTGAMIRQSCATPTSAFMFRQNCIEGIVFDLRTPVVADWLYIIEACMRGRYGYLDEMLLRYRRHDGNTTAYGEDRSYLEDRLVYTDIFLARYRSHFLSIKIQRSQIFYQHGKRCGYEGKYAKAGQFMLYALGEWPFSIGALGGLILSSLGLFGINGWIKARSWGHRLRGVKSAPLPVY